MCRDQDALMALVTAVRLYRKACSTLLGVRYGDGECDAVAILAFEKAVAYIEAVGWEDE